MKSTEIKRIKFTPEMTSQIKDILGRMEKRLILKLSLDNREVSEELEAFIANMVELTDKLSLQIVSRSASSDTAPCVEICYEDGKETGLGFHGVPLEHEFTSFILALYHASDPKDELDESIKKRIASLHTPLDLTVLVTLTCPMCPALVIAAQQIAALNSNVTAHIYDIRHFEKLSNKYNVMSVPCLVVNGEKISFGRKNIRELLDFIEK